MADAVGPAKRPHVAVIGGKSALRAAHRLGAECVYIERPARLSPAKLALADHVLAMDFTDVDQLCRLVHGWHEARPFDAVVCMTEDGLLPAAVLAESLGVPGTPVATVALLRDKEAMRRRLAGSPLAVSSARGRSGPDIARFAARHGYPCVVKPVAGSGSTGVHLVRGERDVSDAVGRLVGLGEPAFLIEPFLAGREYSVESLSFAGEHVVVAVTEKFVGPSFVEIGHVVPARVTPAEAAEVAATATALLDAVGLRDGAAHTEVVLTAGGARVIESHNRVGGDRINELVRIAYGVDMIEAAVRWELFRRRTTVPGMAGSAAAIRFLTPEAGVVRCVAGVEEVTALPSVVEVEVKAVAGQRVGPVRSSADRAGHLLVEAPTPDQAVALAERLASRIVVDTGDPHGEVLRLSIVTAASVVPEVVIFDLGGVVCHFDAQARLDGLAKACGVAPQVLNDDLFASGFDRDCDRGLHSAGDVLERLRALGFPGPMDELRRLWALAFRPDEQVIDLVVRCRTRRPTALLTDNGPVLLSALPKLLPAVHQAFDELLFSCTLGAVKPDAAVFEAALSKLSVTPGQALFVDDSERNVAAARTAGLRAEAFTGEAALSRTLQAAGLID